MKTRIFLDPDGTIDFGLLLIISAPTGIEYSHQCAGLATEERSREGFLIPIGDAERAKPLADFFRKEFKGHSYPPAAQWPRDRTDRLRGLIASIFYWKTNSRGDEEDERLCLELDEAQLTHCTEGWVPVKTAYGAAVLVFKNSD